MRDIIGDQKDVALLLLRIGFGIAFMAAGAAHIIGLDGYKTFFGNIGIPAPDIMATFVAYLEFIGGLAVLVGIFTRTSGLLLAIVMLVASIQARIPGIYAPDENGVVPEIAWYQLFGGGGLRSETILFFAGLALLFIGAGKFSLDHALWGGAKKKPAQPTES